MKIFLGFFLVFLLTPKNLGGFLESSFFVVWGVGQAQWVTIAEPGRCLHIDAGAETKYSVSTRRAVMRLCKDNSNYIMITHGDQDHINQVLWAQRRLNACVVGKIQDPRPKVRAKLEKLTSCERSSPSPHELGINFSWSAERLKSKKPNDLSQVFGWGRFLIPGDSTDRAEKIWSQSLSFSKLASEIQVLVVGHHGSKTSSSEVLFARLKNLEQAIVSARRARYGHPHPFIESRFKHYGVPLLLTEVWGTVGFEPSPNLSSWP